MATESAITMLNRKRGNIKGQLKKVICEDNKIFSELQAQLDVISKLQEKFDVLKEEYYKIVSEKDFEEIEKTLSQIDEDLQNSEEMIQMTILKYLKENIVSQHFMATHKRDATERFIVRLPIKEGKRSSLGESKSMAKRRLNFLWNKLDKNQTMSALYTAFMDEYLALNHMEKVTSNCENCSENYYIPHHAVFQPESISTPLRVVFDASAKCANGVSLNSLLLNGGTVQQDLFSIVTRFRTHTYVFSTDITKMYRQILVEETDRELQRILWKSSSCSPAEIYRLRTITYGTTCAPYLLTRTLEALAEEEQEYFPRASAVLLTDVYVDDILSGSKNLGDTISLQFELINLLNKGGMQLHKWVSNHPDLLNDNKATEYNFSSDSFRFLQKL
ncbi:uncharacterized protein LOC118181557 [Stegodyphus dumicola]|uniref:uncharacterized protein LOC118181557 n=1 Tax=Stegodyphus dumicola TaxID=202533 RepID=UPI0015B261B7|nr:uncharacterized protein LOC118181557 [Stegodyphus dumicola]